MEDLEINSHAKQHDDNEITVLTVKNEKGENIRDAKFVEIMKSARNRLRSATFRNPNPHNPNMRYVGAGNIGNGHRSRSYDATNPINAHSNVLYNGINGSDEAQTHGSVLENDRTSLMLQDANNPRHINPALPDEFGMVRSKATQV